MENISILEVKAHVFYLSFTSLLPDPSLLWFKEGDILFHYPSHFLTLEWKMEAICLLWDTSLLFPGSSSSPTVPG